MITTVARLYRFRARHSVPDLPSPWCEPHWHDYTVEVQVSNSATGPLRVVIDTDLLDAAWEAMKPTGDDLDAIYGAQNTTVEALAGRWLEAFGSAVGWRAGKVTVWEDDSRWGSVSG